MNLKKNKSGFTLLEIIIVIIIVGVLASLALPRFFETVEFSRSSEAVTYIGAIKRGLETCALMSGEENWVPCNTVQEGGLATAPANAHFSYSIGSFAVTGPTAGTFTIVATRTPKAGGSSSSTITFQVNVANGDITRSGTTAFARMN